MTDLKPGDRVRATFDRIGEVGERGRVKFDDSDEAFNIEAMAASGFEFERLEPPFKSGDLVRDKGGEGYYFLLGEKGYRSFMPGRSNEWPYALGLSVAETFPHDKYELVEVP